MRCVKAGWYAKNLLLKDVAYGVYLNIPWIIPETSLSDLRNSTLSELFAFSGIKHDFQCINTCLAPKERVLTMASGNVILTSRSYLCFCAHWWRQILWRPRILTSKNAKPCITSMWIASPYLPDALVAFLYFHICLSGKYENKEKNTH